MAWQPVGSSQYLAVPSPSLGVTAALSAPFSALGYYSSYLRSFFLILVSLGFATSVTTAFFSL